MRKIILNPTDEDLLLIGRNIIRIELMLTSVVVVYQKVHPIVAEEVIDVHELVFPIKHLKRFFKINGESDLAIYNRNPDCAWASKN